MSTRYHSITSFITTHNFLGPLCYNGSQPVVVLSMQSANSRRFLNVLFVAEGPTFSIRGVRAWKTSFFGLSDETALKDSDEGYLVFRTLNVLRFRIGREGAEISRKIENVRVFLPLSCSPQPTAL